jgi:hypothetical protein
MIFHHFPPPPPPPNVEPPENVPENFIFSTSNV